MANVSEKWAIFQFTFCNKYIFMQTGSSVLVYRFFFVFVCLLKYRYSYKCYWLKYAIFYIFSGIVTIIILACLFRFENASVKWSFFGLVIQKKIQHLIDTVSILPELNHFDHYFKWPRPDQMPLPIQNNKFNYFHIINLKMEKSL